MRKIALIVTILILPLHVALSQRKKEDPKHENHYRKALAETDEFKIEISESHSQQEFTILKLSVTNKTNDFLMYNGVETIFRYDFGDYNPNSGALLKGLNIIIEPRRTESQTLKVAGGNNFHVETLKVIFDGFYRIPSQGVIQESEPFLLPPSTNEFQAGNFYCTLEKIKKETKETSLTFKFQYQGSSIAILQPRKVTLKLDNGQEYANDDRKAKSQIISSGEDGKFSASFHVPGKVTDMQFANMELLWKDTFLESEKISLYSPEVTLILDPGLTDGKNR